MQASPDFDVFARAYDTRKPVLVWTSLVADLETPVSVMLKLADGRPMSFLLESVEGGSVRGRYSIIGLKPDLIWRCRGSVAELNRRARSDAHAFEREPKPALASLKDLIAECRVETPAPLPPMASGLFGYMGYNMVGLMERLPDKNPDTLGIPDGMFLRPTIVCIFDNLQDRVTLVTPVWPNPEITARAAYDLARERLAEAMTDFERSLPYRREAGGT
ncbi:MAG TPA: anthranilate synthase component I, partial [Stellaceae bacterium]|nr:anthranilate synthase component I [Stellaceae bacterium]